MSTNGVNITEDADMAECEEEKVVTMMDVLQEQQEFEDDANAVLGASDDKNCTYSKGYIKRQAIYACLTCCVDAKIDPTKRAGVCLACSLNCHENHELIELYTKRNFRCDCGNPKFNNHPCQFVPEKPDLNEDNSYNQNFSGLYCTCHRPYPDPEATFEDEMIQCVVCEDWLHAAHLEANLPTSDYAEMVCKACMEKNEFLQSYSDITVNLDSEEVDILTVNNDSSIALGSAGFNGIIENVNGGVKITDSQETKNETDVDMSVAADTPIDNADSENGNYSELTNATEKKVDQASGKVEENQETAVLNKNTFDNIDELSNNVNKTEETTQNTDSGTKEDNGCTTKADDKEINNEGIHIEAKDQNNDNSLLESIEKLENELGNTGPKNDDIEGKVEKPETKSDEIQTADDSISTLEKTETKEGDNTNVVDKAAESTEMESKLDSVSENNPDSIQNKEDEVDMSENSRSQVESENKITDDSGKQELSEAVKNGVSKETITESNDSDVNTEESAKEIKRKHSTEVEDDLSSKKPKLDDTGCLRPKDVKRRCKGATFWPSDFRQRLCICNTCISMYKDLSVLFLMDPEDTVTAYEALGRQKIDGTATSQYEKGLEALTSLDRIQQINALTEYNKMRDKLLDYLKSFKERKEIVKEEDIKAFFAGMKPKRESDGVYFCR